MTSAAKHAGEGRECTQSAAVYSSGRFLHDCNRLRQIVIQIDDEIDHEAKRP